MSEATITVSVKLFGDLRKYMLRGAPDKQHYALPEGTTIGDLAAQIGMTGDDELIAGVNGEQAARATVLRDGDDVLLVSPMEGG